MGKLFVKGYAVKGIRELYALDYIGLVRRGEGDNPDRFYLTGVYNKGSYKGSWVTCGDEQGNIRFEDCVMEIGKTADTDSTTEV